MDEIGGGEAASDGKLRKAKVEGPLGAMDDAEQEELEGEVAAMQFAAGRSMEQVAVEWERDVAWVEEAVRRALLASIPERVGGLKAARDPGRGERSAARSRLEEMQRRLEWEP